MIRRASCSHVKWLAPIRIIVGFSAGGPNDLAVRPIAQKLDEMLGQPVVIDYHRRQRQINRILQLPDVRERLAVDGLEPVGGSPERFREVLKRDIAKWQKVVRVGNIKSGS